MAKIVIDAREWQESTGRYVSRLVQNLEKIDSEHKYMVLMEPQDLDTWQPSNPHFQKIACPYKEFTFAEQLGLLHQIRSLKPDLVHFSMIQQPVLYRGKVVTTVHDLTTARFKNPAKNPLVFWAKQQVYRAVIQIVARKSRHIITPTQFVKDDVVSYTHINPAKVTFTHEAVDGFDDIPEPIASFEGKAFIMFNGRPLPHKNLHRLIEAFAILAPKYPDLYLMIAGKKNAMHDSYVAFVEKLELADRVIFTDWITDGQLTWALQHCRAYVYPSLSEGFGLPPLEAMLNDAPVVASNISCIPEVCGEAAHYFNPFDVQDMAQKISQVLDDVQLRNQLLAEGKKQIKKYSWRRMAEQTLAVYDNVLREK